MWEFWEPIILSAFARSLQCVESTGVKRRQRTAVVHSCPQNHVVINQLSCGFNPSLFFQFLDLFKAFFFSDHNCLSFCFDTKITVYHTVSTALIIVCMTCSILICKVAGFYSLFHPFNCLSNHMAGTDQCYMHLFIYLFILALQHTYNLICTICYI